MSLEMAPETFFSMPVRPARRAWAWAQLTTGDTSVLALLQAIKSGHLPQVGASMRTWEAHAVYQDRQFRDQWAVLRALLACAQIAALTGETADTLPVILTTLLPDSSVPPAAESRRAAKEPEQWRSFLHRWFWQLTWPAAHETVWFWDVLLTFMNTPRPVAHTESVSVLLVTHEGAVARLFLERLADEGEGILYPDPCSMAFVVQAQDFRQSVQNAIAAVRDGGLWPSAPAVDVRWKLLRQDNQPILQLNGGSAGAAFALGLARLFAGGIPSDSLEAFR